MQWCIVVLCKIFVNAMMYCIKVSWKKLRKTCPWWGRGWVSEGKKSKQLESTKTGRNKFLHPTICIIPAPWLLSSTCCFSTELLIFIISVRLYINEYNVEYLKGAPPHTTSHITQLPTSLFHPVPSNNTFIQN